MNEFCAHLTPIRLLAFLYYSDREAQRYTEWRKKKKIKRNRCKRTRTARVNKTRTNNESKKEIKISVQTCRSTAKLTRHVIA